jgi:hypothetical protein
MASIGDINSTLQNIARQLGLSAQSDQLAVPAATTTSSPKFTGVALSTTGSTVLVATSAIRHGIMFHNPGATATIYVFPSNIATVPVTSSLAGALAIAPGSTVQWPPSQFANVNAGFSGFAGTGTSQPFTVIEFY